MVDRSPELAGKKFNEGTIGTIALKMQWYLKFGNSKVPECYNYESKQITNDSWYYLDEITEFDWVSSDSSINMVGDFSESKEFDHITNSIKVTEQIPAREKDTIETTEALPVTSEVLPSASRSGRVRKRPVYLEEYLDENDEMVLEEKMESQQKITHYKQADADVKKIMDHLYKLDTDPGSFSTTKISIAYEKSNTL